MSEQKCELCGKDFPEKYQGTFLDLHCDECLDKRFDEIMDSD